jgi:hypothetical protein
MAGGSAAADSTKSDGLFMQVEMPIGLGFDAASL